MVESFSLDKNWKGEQKITIGLDFWRHFSQDREVFLEEVSDHTMTVLYEIIKKSPDRAYEWSLIKTIIMRDNWKSNTMGDLLQVDFKHHSQLVLQFGNLEKGAQMQFIERAWGLVKWQRKR